MANYKPKACEQYGTEFTSRQPNTKYCTSICRDRAKYVRTKKQTTTHSQKQCAGCSKAFTPHHKLTAYCTKKCSNASAQRRRRQRRRQDKGTPSKTCIICGTQLAPNTLAVKYCSSECRREGKLKTDREFMRKWRQENPQLNAERRKREDPKLRLQRTLRWREQHPEQAKEWARAYRQANRESEAARQRRWRQSPYGKVAYREANRKWALRHPEAAGEVRARRARAEAEGNATPNLIQAKWEASSGTCCLCGESINPDLKSPDPMSLTVEHKVPIARGGRHDIDNIDFAHRVCNSSKGARTTEEYMERRKLAS